MTCIQRIFALCLVLCTVAPFKVHANEPLGKKPAHVVGGPSTVVNEKAISRKIWAPGIDEGYVPQGLAWTPGVVYVSGYRSTDPKVGKGPCRIFKVDSESGTLIAHFDLPDDCGHAGGLAVIGPVTLVASDTRRLYRIDMEKAFSQRKTGDAVTGVVTLGGEIKGSFIDFDGKALFVGSFDNDPSKAKGHFLPLSIFDTHRGKAVNEAAALRSISLPSNAQGAAFDKAGQLWITASSSRFGLLYRLDPLTGQIAASFDMVIGIEDISFDEDGQLWAVSEAGSLRWQRWNTTFPVLFRMDIQKLKAK